MRAAWRRLTGGRVPGPSRVLAAVLLVTVFLVTAAPRLLEDFQTRALRASVAEAPAIDQSLSIGTGWPLYLASNVFSTPGYPAPRRLAAQQRALAAGLHPPLKAVPGAGWTGVSTPFANVLGPVGRAYNGHLDPQLELAYRDPVAGHLQVTSGTLPRRAATTAAGRRRVPELEVAVTEATAARFGLHPGSQMPIAVPVTIGQLLDASEKPPPTAILRVTGIVRPTGTAEAFWSSDNIVGTPSLQDAGSREEHWAGAALLGPAEIAALPAVFRSSQQVNILWDLPLQLGTLTASQVPQIQRTLQALQVTGPTTSNGDYPQPLVIVDSPVDTLTRFQAQATAADQVLSLIITGLFLIGLVLVGLAARLLTARREPELAALRARGISLPGLAWRVLADTGPVLVIAAAAGIVLGSVASRGESVISSWELAVAMTAAAAAAPPLLAVARHRQAVRSSAGRADVTIRRRSPRRAVAELSAAVLAVGVVVALRQRGPGHSVGVNVLTGTGPQLVALLAALVAIRCYPLPLRAALRLAGRRRGAASYLGLARAARAASTALLPALALILAMALAGFGGMVVTTIGQARTADSWRQVGADASIAVGDSNPISPAATRALRRVPGTQQAVTVSNEPGELVIGGRQLNITAVNAAPAAYAALSAATPFGSFKPSVIGPGPAAKSPGAAIPVLVSPAVAAQLNRRTGVLTVDVDRALRVRMAGVLDATPAVPSGAFVVIPAWAANRDDGPWPVNQALLTGPAISGPALRATVAGHIPDGHLQVRADVLRRAVTASPLASPAQRLFALCLGAAALLAVAAAGLGMVLSADSRRRLLSTLTALGLRSRQLRAVALLESLPLLIVSVAGGLLAALALPAAVGPALSLAVFVGPGPPVAVQPGLLPLLAAAVGTTVVVLVIALGQSSAVGRADLGQAMREGDGG
jgi:putative ABC transport system permease protein